MDSAKKVGDKGWRERERRDQVPIWRNQEGEEGRRGKTFAPVSPPLLSQSAAATGGGESSPPPSPPPPSSPDAAPQ